MRRGDCLHTRTVERPTSRKQGKHEGDDLITALLVKEEESPFAFMLQGLGGNSCYALSINYAISCCNLASVTVIKRSDLLTASFEPLPHPT